MTNEKDELPPFTELPVVLTRAGFVERLWAEYNQAGRAVTKGQLLAEAAAEIERLTAENGNLRHAFRVNILRLAPGTSHAEIDELLAALKDTTP